MLNNLEHHHDQTDLKEAFYPTIERSIAWNTDGRLESAVVHLPDADEVYGFTIEASECDRTLGRQLEDVLTRSADVTHGATDQPPEAYLFTADSAIPMADAVRGYFQAARRSVPLLGTINANRAAADRHFDDDEAPVRPPFREVGRLKELTDGMKHVCIVDQYVASGITIQYASKLLRYAGVEVRTAIRGNWYHNANINDDQIDMEKLTSRHAAFFRSAGKLAWENAI